jgi:hypothetical protein
MRDDAFDRALHDLSTALEGAWTSSVDADRVRVMTRARGEGFHGEIVVESNARDDLVDRFTSVAIAHELPRGLFYDADEISGTRSDGWRCVTSGDVDPERMASASGTSTASCARLITEDESTFRDDGFPLTLKAHARYGEARSGGGSVTYDVKPALVVMRERDGGLHVAASTGGGTWEVPVGDTSRAGLVRAATDVSVVIGAIVVLIAVFSSKTDVIANARTDARARKRR